MLLYQSIDGLTFISDDVAPYAKTSFGNMGFSKSVCSKEIIDFNEELPLINIQFQCERTTTISDVLDCGLLLSSKLDLGSDNVLATCDSSHYLEGSVSERLTRNHFQHDKF